MTAPPLPDARDHRVGDSRVDEMRELVSGVDALYLSGKAAIPPDLAASLRECRASAQETDSVVPFDVGPITFTLPPYGLSRRYPFRLDHEWGAIGLCLGATTVPALRFQPRAEFLHAVGPSEVVGWCRDVLAPAVGEVALTVSRLDLFADWQGWVPRASDEDRFVTRARSMVTYKYDDAFTGFVIGRRSTGTLSGRIYDKTQDSANKGIAYWPLVWGAAHDPTQSVWRTEFEINRNLLREFRLNDPDHALAGVGDLWEYATEWLSLRDPSDDQTKARWPVAPEWERVRRARLGRAVIGIDRVREQRYLSTVENLMPGTVGYLSSLAALLKYRDLEPMLPTLQRLVDEYDERRGFSFADRVAKKRREMRQAS